MLKHRVIPCLLLDNRRLVKTRTFKKPTYVGDPINAIRIFNEKEVDELIVVDISCTRRDREPDYSFIEQFAGECFMPLCYGGGIKTLDQAKKIIFSGVEKICVQSVALDNPQMLKVFADNLGSQSVVLSVDVKKNWLGRYKLYDSRYKKIVKGDLCDHILNAVALGVGEILLNFVDNDGEMAGYDLPLIELIAGLLDIPVIALGGAGTLRHLREAVDVGASAVAAGSMFVFYGIHRAVLISYPKYSDLESLFEGT